MTMTMLCGTFFIFIFREEAFLFCIASFVSFVAAAVILS